MAARTVASALAGIAYVFAAAVSVPAPLLAQQSGLAVTKPTPDQQWQDVSARLLPPTARITQAKAKRTKEERAADKAATRLHLVAIARELNAFRKENPTHPKAAEARLKETRSLLIAALLGEKLDNAELQADIEVVRRDVSLSAPDRFEVVALGERLLVRGAAKNRSEASIASEASARYLIREFPEQAGGYSELLHAGLIATPERSVALAQQVLDGPAPSAVKALAREVITRQTISGKALADVIGGQPGAAALLRETSGRPVVIYTWSPEDAISMERAKALGASIPADAVVWGVNVSPDVGAALAAAKSSALPGQQLYGARGFDSPVVTRLALTASRLVYAADSRGKITNLSDLRDPAAALAKLN
jgi:hypothetical protein